MQVAQTYDPNEIIEKHTETPSGMTFYNSLEAITSEPRLYQYSHLLIKAWKEMQLSGILCVDGAPTLYLRMTDGKIDAQKAQEYQRLFWNQGTASLLVLVDSQNVRIFSGMSVPGKPGDESATGAGLVEKIDQAEYAIGIHDFYIRLGTGAYYRQHENKFRKKQTVDVYLLENLRALRNLFTRNKNRMPVEVAHAFLTRLLFTCYLIDRGIIDLTDYGCDARSRLIHMLDIGNLVESKQMLYKLFNDLKDKFNGSMFDCSSEEESAFTLEHLDAVVRFLKGHEISTGQLTLGFWAYDFEWIPVETISAVYEDFLKSENETEKRSSGAYYTPKFLAETVIGVTLEKQTSLKNRKFFDPACGSGIFLVILFNRLAYEWMDRHPSADYQTKADALLGILEHQIFGMDINETACRIAGFSLYLAFLDCFDPPDITEYMEHTGKKLPRIIQYDSQDKPKPDFPVIRKADYLELYSEYNAKFDYIVGNPPWSGSGKERTERKFTVLIPKSLTHEGKACILLPARLFLNKKLVSFQKEWLKRVTLEKVIQLADFRKILFKHARCPGMIVRFTAKPPASGSIPIEYEVPKVSRTDPREGKIQVFPADRKCIRLGELLAAGEDEEIPMIWKKYLWGTSRDQKFLQLLRVMPALGEIAGSSKVAKRWVCGSGLKPYRTRISGKQKPGWWKESHLFVKNDSNFPGLFLLESDCEKIGDRFQSLERTREPKIFQPPLIILNTGFTKTAFCSFPALFQHSLYSISGPAEDEELLLFLTAYLRSKLAKYFLFHTAANWGTERTKVHLFELLRLPFPLPGNEFVHPDSKDIVKVVVHKMREFKTFLYDLYDQADKNDHTPFSSTTRKKIKELREQKEKVLQSELDNLINKYFNLIDQEIVLIEDTTNIFIPSSTPDRSEAEIKTLIPIIGNNIKSYEDGLSAYAETLLKTLNQWALESGSEIQVQATGYADGKTLAMITLEQTATPKTFEQKNMEDRLKRVLKKLQMRATEQSGRLDYLRGIIIFEGQVIHIVKPLELVHWTRTAALNDAAEIYARTARARREKDHVPHRC